MPSMPAGDERKRLAAQMSGRLNFSTLKSKTLPMTIRPLDAPPFTVVDGEVVTTDPQAQQP